MPWNYLDNMGANELFGKHGCQGIICYNMGANELFENMGAKELFGKHGIIGKNTLERDNGNALHGTW